MAFENLNRTDRRAMSKYARAEAEKRPVKLTEIPRRSWPRYPNPDHEPTNVWQNRKYLVQLFGEQPAYGIETLRMTVCRVTLGNDGHWDAGLSWEELQDIKHEIGFGAWYGLEIYPRAWDVVNVANMRHIWLLAKPLELGWFKDVKR